MFLWPTAIFSCSLLYLPLLTNISSQDSVSLDSLDPPISVFDMLSSLAGGGGVCFIWEERWCSSAQAFHWKAFSISNPISPCGRYLASGMFMPMTLKVTKFLLWCSYSVSFWMSICVSQNSFSDSCHFSHTKSHSPSLYLSDTGNGIPPVGAIAQAEHLRLTSVNSLSLTLTSNLSWNSLGTMFK